MQARSQGGLGARPPGLVKFESVPPLKTGIIQIYVVHILAVPSYEFKLATGLNE